MLHTQVLCRPQRGLVALLSSFRKAPAEHSARAWALTSAFQPGVQTSLRQGIPRTGQQHMAPRQHRLVAEDGRFVEIVFGVTRLIGVELKRRLFDEQQK